MHVRISLETKYLAAVKRALDRRVVSDEAVPADVVRINSRGKRRRLRVEELLTAATACRRAGLI